MLQDAKIQTIYFSLLPIEIFAEIWYNIKNWVWMNRSGDWMNIDKYKKKLEDQNVSYVDLGNWLAKYRPKF